MFGFDKKNCQSGRITVNGRIFKATFWNDSHFGLPWFSVTEVVTNAKGKERLIEVSEGWTGENRVEMVKCKIKEYLDREIKKNEERQQIDELCSASKEE